MDVWEVKKEDEMLSFETLRGHHAAKFAASLPEYTDTETYRQEKRQTAIVERIIYLTVKVSREDFPAISADLPVSYRLSCAQADWKLFLERVRKTLDLEYIDSIIDRTNMAAVHRVQRLVDGGEYYVRITETSAVVEALITHKVPIGDSWEITKHISSASEEVVWHSGKINAINSRVDELISRPKIRETERSACCAILKAESPDAVLVAVGVVMTEVETPVPFSPSVFSPDPEVDVVNVHRLALEQLNRLAMKGKGKEIANVCINFIQETIERFKEDTDVVVLGLRLVSEIMPDLVLFKLQVLHLLLNCVQLYAPPEHPCRPRNPNRLDGAGKELLEKELAIKREEDRRIREEAARLAEEERLRLEEEARRIKAEQDELERLRLEEEKKQEKFRRKIAKAKAKQQKALRMMLAQGITPEIPSRSLEEVRSIRKWSGSSGSSSGILDGPPKSGVILPPVPYQLSIPRPLSAKSTKAEYNEAAGGDEIEPLKNTLVLKPLPVVSGVKFRGLSWKMKKNMCLTQALISIYKFVSTSFGYREAAYLVFLHEELSEVALIFSDGLNDNDEDIASLASDAPTMVTSNSPRTALSSRADDDDTIGSSKISIDPLLGLEIDAVSEVSMQTVDLDFVNEELTPRVNMGDPQLTYPEFELPEKDEEEEEEEDITNVAIDSDPAKAAVVAAPIGIQRGRKKKPSAEEEAANAAKSSSGLIVYASVIKSDAVLDYRARYLSRPYDPLVLCMAMFSKHNDLDETDREMATVWLRLWDDSSLEFKALVKRGFDYTDL